MPSNYPPGVTGNEDYFQDDSEIRIRKARHKKEDKKRIKEIMKMQAEEAKLRKGNLG